MLDASCRFVWLRRDNRWGESQFSELEECLCLELLWSLVFGAWSLRMSFSLPQRPLVAVVLGLDSGSTLLQALGANAV